MKNLFYAFCFAMAAPVFGGDWEVFTSEHRCFKGNTQAGLAETIQKYANSISILEFRSCAPQDDMIDLLGSIPLPALHTVKFLFVDFSARNFETIAKVVENRWLKVVLFGMGEMQSANLFNYFAENSLPLGSLDLNCTPFNPENFFNSDTMLRFPALNLQRIQSLRFCHDHMGPKGAKLLSKAFMPQLNKAIFMGNQIGDAGYSHLSKVRWPQLERMTIGEDPLTTTVSVQKAHWPQIAEVRFSGRNSRSLEI